MKTKFSGILTLLLAFVVQVSLAQTTVSGTVSEENGPLPGASVLVKGTATGAQTDFDGNYSITASATDVLVFSYVGFTPQEVTVGAQSTINITLASDNALDEVIVTAQGVKREKKSLGYSVSEVKSEKLESQATPDLGAVLRGEAAGINITTTSGSSGSSSNIIIRGYTSISGSNQPLFIVDGVPISGDTNADFNNTDGFIDNINQTSRFSDIDPNNIESVNILKGIQAATLYGSQGRNGVILITTKTGSGKGTAGQKTEITVSQSTFISEAHLPDYQNEFGGGFSQRFGFFVSNFGPAFNEQNDAAFGSNFIRREGNRVFINNPLTGLSDQSLLTGLEDFITDDYEYRPYNSVDQFFRTGVSTTTSIGARGGNEDANFAINYSHYDEEGITPGNGVTRNNISLGGKAKLSNKFTVQGSANFSINDVTSPPISAATGQGTGTGGNSSSVFSELLFTPRHIDLFSLPFQSLNGNTIYYRSGNDIQNPLWTVNNAFTGSRTVRTNGQATITYGFNENNSLSYRSTIDAFTESTFNSQNAGGVQGNVTGFHNTSQNVSAIFDNTISYNGNVNFNEKHNLTYTAGATSRNTNFRTTFQSSTDQLVFGTLKHVNFVNQTAGEADFEDNVIGVYGDATYGYNNYLFFNGSLRNDWTSTLESDNNSILYTGASLSFVATDAIESIKGWGLSYLKGRLSFGQSAGFPTPFNTRNILNLTARNFITPTGTVTASNSISNRLGNPDLEPETISEIEAGIDARFFKNRFGLNVSVFQKTTDDLITDRNLDPATGFTVIRINAGELEVEGIEIDFDAMPIKTEDFSWNINGNFYADENTIISLPDGIEQIALTAGFSGAQNFAIAGQPFGVLQGFAVQRDENGNALINGADGTYLLDTDLSILGDPNPDWTTNITNSFKYKDFTFSFEWQYRHGGDILASTASTLLGRGAIDIGVDRSSNFILPGILPDGSPNNLVLTASELFFNINGANPENRIYDGSTIRLNDVSLSYDLPKKFLEKTPFGSLNLRVNGSNLWYRAVNFPIDANFDTNALSTGVGNGQGIDFFSGPTTRRYGVSLKATF